MQAKITSATDDFVNDDFLYRTDNGYVVYDRLFAFRQALIDWPNRALKTYFSLWVFAYPESHEIFSIDISVS